MSLSGPLCLRQGYGGCTCSQCRIWINRWDKELETFAVIDTMTRDGKCLFQIYEFLRAQQPDILRLHHKFIEDQYIKNRTKDLKPRIKMKIPPPSNGQLGPSS